jgi:hypothetical protein
VLAQIGSLQTASQTVYVTVRPDTLRRVLTATTGTDTLSLDIGKDSASAITTLKLSTVVRGIGGRVVPGVFVRYSLVTPVSSKTAAPAAYLLDDANNIFIRGQSTPDTADISGLTGRTLAINARLVADANVVNPGNITSIEVLATAMYRGVPLQGSPLHILVPVKGLAF